MTDTLSDKDVARITAYQLVRTPIAPADLCLVFGTRHGVREFADAALGLWRGGHTRRFVVSGGATQGIAETEADIIADMLIAGGIPGQAILREPMARHTGENVTLSRPLIDRSWGLDTIRSVIGIGKICTARRYLMTLERHWPDVQKMLVPINIHGVAREAWPDSPTLRPRVLAEHAKFAPYLKAGYITELDPATCTLLA
ncbi:MAG: YdcF family protein [Pseudomonadota bacterium]